MRKALREGSLLAVVLFFPFLQDLAATEYQAEEAFFYRAAVETEHTGYTGTGYVNFINETGSYIEFTVGMAETGEQTLTVRFANGGSSARPMEVHINGILVNPSLEFAPTGGWAVWAEKSFTAVLSQGINTVKFTSTASEGGPNFDYLGVTGTQAAKYTLTVTIEGNGTVSISPEGSSFFEGQALTLTANPAITSSFEGWSGDYTGSSETIEIILSADMSLTATFTDLNIEIPGPDFSMRGYATLSGEGYETTTGGTGGNVTTVTTLAELQAFASSRENNTTPEILYIKGKISAPSTTVVTIKHGANLTILGEGYFGELENVGLNIRNYKNVIIRNMKIHEVEYPNDAITIDECRHVWVDHNELYSRIGAGIGVDTYDGLLDIKNGSRYVTVSWNYLHHHMKTMLIGHSDNNGETDQQFRITLHHNYYSNTDGRNPSLRFGAVHMFNNYLENIADYGIAIRQGAHAKLENNHYESVRLPIATDKFSGPEGFACVSGNIYTGSCTEASNSITQTDCDFWNDLPYQYQLDPANTVAALVQLYAGVGIISTGETVYLSSLSADIGTLHPSFNPEVTQYGLVVPAGTNQVNLAAETDIPGASVTGAGISQEIPGTAVIVVTSGDGSLSREYRVDIMYDALSDDATLTSLVSGIGSLEPDFDPAVTSYNLVLPEGSTSVSLHATTTHPNASVSGDGLFESLPVTVEITITAEDGITTLTYTVNISVATGTRPPDVHHNIRIYPNPASENLWVSLPSPAEIGVFDLRGVKLMERSAGAGVAELDLTGLSSGWYILRVQTADHIVSMKFIRK